jgi:sugar O-acyltransferase (sialic acid O-acetyltransferase NeuD family)
MKDVAIYGCGGFGLEIAAMLKKMNETSQEWNLIGFFDDGVAAGTTNRYGSVLGNIDYLNDFPDELNIIIAIATPKYIKKVVSSITNPRIKFPNIFAPNVNIFDKDAFSIGIGNVVFWGCRISCEVSMGNFNLLNGAVSLGHEVHIGDFNVLSPSTRLSGACSVGDENFFGVQSTVLQGVRIGNRTKIGAGSMVLRPTKDDCLYIGNPARKMDAHLNI